MYWWYLSDSELYVFVKYLSTSQIYDCIVWNTLQIQKRKGKKKETKEGERKNGEV